MSLDVDPLRSRAVLLGVSFFPRDPERLQPLPAIRTNLRDLERALADPTILGLDPRHITVVDDRPSSEMLSKLVEVADEAEDTLIVYYAGHGVPGSMSLYLTGTDSSERTIEFDGMPFDQLRRALNTSPARKKVLILDCCYSGRAIEVMGTADAMLQASIEDLEGTYTLASSGATEASAAPPGERYTAFTGELLRVLHEGIADAPPTLQLNEIFRALRLGLRRNPKYPAPRQAAKGTAGDIDFIHNRAWRPQTVACEPESARAGPSATRPASDWQEELAQRLDRQAQLIEALQRQLQERSAAEAEKLAHTSVAQGLAEDRAVFEKLATRDDARSDRDQTYAEMLRMQKARIAELEAALADFGRPPPPPPPPGGSRAGTRPSKQRPAAPAVGQRIGYALAALFAGFFRFHRPDGSAVEPQSWTGSGSGPDRARSGGRSARVAGEPSQTGRGAGKPLGWAGRIGLLVFVLFGQMGVVAGAVNGLSSRRGSPGEVLPLMMLFGCFGLVIWLGLRRRYRATNRAFCWAMLPILVGPEVFFALVCFGLLA